MKYKLEICVLLAAAFLAATSCTHPGTHHEPPQKQPEILQSAEEVKKADIDGIVAKAADSVAKGDFKSALDAHRKGAEKYPGETSLEESFLATLEDIKKAADKALDDCDFVLSGKTYYLLLKNVPATNGASARLSFTKKVLADGIDASRSVLSQQALGQYREGNIDSALAIWKNILSFDPGNKSIKKFIDTATTQKKNLKKSN